MRKTRVPNNRVQKEADFTPMLADFLDDLKARLKKDIDTSFNIITDLLKENSEHGSKSARRKI